MKRVIDIVLSSIALSTLFVPLAIVALLIYVRLGRPIFFIQERPGLHGKLFSLLKFRTMTNLTDSAGVLLPDEQRLDHFGRVLRSLSIDELPELWNVLKGEMSLVGPRPLLSKYLELYCPNQARRHEVRPGITGWAQVNGRNSISWEQKFELDVWYVDHQSLWLDFKIMAMTLLTVLRRTGTSASQHATMPEFSGNKHRIEGGRDNSICVIGAGGHAKIVVAVAEATGHTISKIFDDDPAKANVMLLSHCVSTPIPPNDWWRNWNGVAILAIGDNAMRKRLADQIDARFGVLIDLAAAVHRSATIGAGTIICPGAIVNPDAKIGRHCIINSGAVVEHDCEVGDFSHIAPRACLAGGVTIGCGTLVGVGATILPGRSVGDWSIVGGGAVVTHSVKTGARVLGVPAR